jgi:hypothetical protein
MHIEMQLMSIDAHWNALNVREVLNQSEKNNKAFISLNIHWRNIKCMRIFMSN